MPNIRTDLLRALVTVVELRSFTKAAYALGMTQPAVSAQIKRLQLVVGCELLDKSAPGVILTPVGAAVVEHARRLLAINDEIMQIANGRRPARTVRIGIPSDYSGERISPTLARYRVRRPDLRFIVSAGTSDSLLHDIQGDDLDIALAVTLGEPPIAPRHAWMRQAVWVHSGTIQIDAEAPVPLVCYGEDCACQRLAVAALQRAGRECEFVYTTRSIVSLAAAVREGFGVMVMPRGRALNNGLKIWEDGPLPQLPELHCGIFVREDRDCTACLELADYLAADLLADRQALERGGVVSALRTMTRR